MKEEKETIVRISLPENYTGKKVAIITYFAQGRGISSPVYPFFGNYETVYAPAVTSVVVPVAVIVLCALFIVLISVIFVLDSSNGKADVRILLLVLSFMLLFLGKAYRSMGTSSILSEHMDLSFLEELYMAPLYLYIALHLTKWRKYLLSASVVLWFLYEGAGMFQNAKAGEIVLINGNGARALVLFASVMIAFFLEYVCFGREKKKETGAYYLPYGILIVVVSVLRLLYGAREWDGDVGMYLLQMLKSAIRGYYFSVVHFFADICGIMTMLILVLEFIRKTIREKETLSVLEERSRLTLEGYNRMLEAEEATNSVRHEMRHHMIALMGILKDGEKQRACDYILSVTKGLDTLPVFRYSQNILVNVIAGEYLDRAKKLGVEVVHSLFVPAELKIADEDISVFLSNMLENALEACERMEPGQERYIHVKMHVNENFL